MSRLIVRHLPKNITETKLRELFSEKGVVTDVQLKYTKEGKFRRFAFVGYKTEEQAQLAQSYFNQSCIETCKISVELCCNLGDPSKPRAWSKYATDSSHNKVDKASDAKSKEASTDFSEKSDVKSDKTGEKKEKKKKKTDKNDNKELRKALEKHKDDPLFMEFLEAHRGNNMKAVWKNDIETSVEITGKSSGVDDSKDEEDTAESENKEEKEERKKEKEKIADKAISDLEYMEALKKKQDVKQEEKSLVKDASKHGLLKLFTVKVSGLGYKHLKKDIKQFFRPLVPKSIRIPRKIKGIAYLGFKTELQLKKALLKNKSFLNGKQIFVSKYERKEKSSENTNNKINVKWKKQEESLKDEETIAESGRIFIRNLTYTTTEDDVRKLFEKYGLLSEVNLPVDKVTRKPKGFGTVTFLMPEHAIKAYVELDGTVIDGRMLHLLPGKAKTSLEDIDTENLTYKQKKELEMKKTASSSHNWNTLFLGQNAVVDAIANIYNTTKEKVLEDESRGMSAAVKLALGETQIAHDTKAFLEENGVCLDAFNQAPKERSRSTILVKNLPALTKSDDIREMFARHGELGRVILPPSGVTALVEFLEPSEARKAFTKLAYTKFKHLPLYLEWAPDNSFTAPASKSKASKNKTSKGNATRSSNVEGATEGGGATREYKENANNANKKADEDHEEPEPDTTLFVKNINFATKVEELKSYFAKCGRIHYATIATKKDSKNPGSNLSMGYGFVRYKRKHDADRALKTLQMTVLDGKSLELKRSERILMSDVKTARRKSKITDQTGSKILVRNVPFQATIAEVTELFKAFGQLKAARLPKKTIGFEKHRGFAFIEYYTKEDAKRAFDSLCQSTHLYGRRLVFEWAQTVEDIEEIRKRTAKRFLQGSSAKRFKKSTLNVESDVEDS
ncbi:PREDICTED: probable RNA-binding protein 19 [Dinoponera quadriceps]|uniref:Probable RNA-binding protein 19 n=1 Tax=Dinoponera quadriceps TaxID=609295 RepID=A0A6P3XR08_DINQU|nr:PREDICTED: probable RNA-binding protein 19 [Dinoponera quadriceps]